MCIYICGGGGGGAWCGLVLCVRECVRACLRACLRAVCVHVCVCVCVYLSHLRSCLQLRKMLYCTTAKRKMSLPYHMTNISQISTDCWIREFCKRTPV